jgi:valyl-tRNA synthetase
MQAHQTASTFFWSIYCDRYLEMIKGRFADDAGVDGQERASARTALWRSFRAVLGLFAPFAPFVTEHLYQRWYQPHEGAASLHVTAWPAAEAAWRGERRTIDLMAIVLDHVRARRSQLRLGSRARVGVLVLHPTTSEAAGLARVIGEPLRVAARAAQVRYQPAGHGSGVPGLAIDVIPDR